MEKDAEYNKLSKRIGRYSSVVGAAAKVGAKSALALATGQKDLTEKAVLLRTILGQLKGPLMKIGQLLATIPDFLPPEYARELMSLQAEAPAMGWSFVRRRMNTELGLEWEKKFGSFDHEAAAAASLGQVHKATPHDGTVVACKLQYADMVSVVEADIAQLKVLFGLIDHFDGALRTQEAPYQEIATRLREELDYKREANAMRLYAHMLNDVPGVHVPTPVDKLSTDRLLTMTWLDGIKLVEAVEKLDQQARNEVAVNLFHAWYTPFYKYGVIHGDPHLGNYTIRADNSINLLDFGCIRIFEPRLIQAVILLFTALRDHDDELAMEAYRLWGFTDISKELFDVLSLWARFIYAPVLHDDVRPLTETNDVALGRETAKKIHTELKRLGGVSVPPEFVLIDRASVGLGSVFLRLKAEVNWFRLFGDLTKDFDVDSLAKRQSESLAQFGF